MFGGFTNMLSISYFSRKNILNVFINVEIGHFYINIVRMKSSKRFALSNPLVNFLQNSNAQRSNFSILEPLFVGQL